MNAKFAIFIVIGTLVVTALYCSSTNFVSATTNCYTSGEHYVCIFTADSVKPPVQAFLYCDKDGKNCTITWLDKVNPVTPEVKNAIKNAQVANLAKGNVEGSNSESTINNSPNPPQCPTTGPIPPDCTMKPPLK
jgi:hypothetical protein